MGEFRAANNAMDMTSWTDAVTLMAVKLASVRILHYGDEHGASLSDFMQSVRRFKYCWPTITDRELVHQAISCLTGNAFEFAEQLDTTSLTLEGLQKLLEDKFEEKPSYVELRNAFRRLTQEEDETAKQFLLRLEEAATKLFAARNSHPEETSAVKEFEFQKELKIQFQSGLQDDLAYAIAISAHTELKEMLKVATSVEQFRRLRRPTTTSKDVFAPPTNPFARRRPVIMQKSLSEKPKPVPPATQQPPAPAKIENQ
ncbi:uncharacterized protein LOC132203422 [Neocloeon triangulifer]|uniref:uncharacterized protein LOC132203422 n=1 Tax=Neocloeon triangulifer TaxID=2078957 RepID=UPI00286F5156|nr:uncharacterized protein LOC132203422 [Neocloeon triangulifer]